MTKDTRTKQRVETTYTPAEFLATLADHVPDRYRHTVPYFGLLAPRVKCQTHDTVFALVARSGGGSPDGSDGRRHCRNALAWTRWSTATASECGGLVAFHPASRNDSLPARAYASPAGSEPPASRDLTAPRSRDPPGSMGQLAAAIEVTWIVWVLESSVPTTATFFPANSLDLSWSLNR